MCCSRDVMQAPDTMLSAIVCAAFWRTVRIPKTKEEDFALLKTNQHFFHVKQTSISNLVSNA